MQHLINAVRRDQLAAGGIVVDKGAGGRVCNCARNTFSANRRISIKNGL